MNSTETDIIHLALENLEKTTHIKGKWKGFERKEIDGKIEFKVGCNPSQK